MQPEYRHNQIECFEEHIMLDNFNLLISTSRRNERNACSEMWYLLGELGDKAAKVDITPISGLIVANTLLDPIEAINKLRENIKEKPWEFRYILKIVPIQKIVQTSGENIKKVALNLAKKISNQEGYKIAVRKRSTNLSSTDIIDMIAPDIKRKVNLDNSDLILQIEIIGEISGISLIKPNDILSVDIEKRNSHMAK